MLGPTVTCILRPTFSHTLLARVEASEADAQFELGRLHFEGREESSTSGSSGPHVVSSFTPGVRRDPDRAARLLRLAADQGHEEARKLLEVVRLHSASGAH